ncbi:MAG: ABC transporter ATP-binding protein/permease [Chloroflexi bacterium]|nr:ABC transporter ATP-binding protein/permease [Chloroflexota bacterium]
MAYTSVRHQGRFLVRYLARERGALVVLAAVIALVLTIQLVTPQIVRAFIDTAERKGPLSLLLSLAAGYLGLGFINQGLGIFEAYFAQTLAWTVTNRVRLDLVQHCLQLDRSFHAARTPGELIERVDGDVNNLANFFSRFIIYVFGNALLLIGILVMLYYVDWRVGLTMTLFAGGAMTLLFGARNWAGKRWAAVRQSAAELYGFIGERLAAIEDLRANGAVAYTLTQMQRIFVRFLPRQLASGVAWALTDNASYTTFTVGTGLALLWAGYLFHRGEITIGTAFLIYQYNELLRQPLEQIRNQLQDLQRAVAGLIRIEELFGIKPLITDGPGCSVLQGPLGLEFQEVTFSYESGEHVLREISLTIPPRRVVGVLGPTGSGKTTLARLLMRFHDPQEGSIRLGGVDLRQWRLAELRQHLGVVTQEVQLFRAPLRDNLTLFDPHLQDGHIINALNDLGLGSWLRSLPAGLDTPLQPGGLSAGEAQLLAFSRVFLRNPQLIILDEASSRIDPATERHVRFALERLLAGRTAIIIAHRLSTLDLVDDVLLLSHGQIVEYGARAELVRDPTSQLAALLQVGLEVALV